MSDFADRQRATADGRQETARRRKGSGATGPGDAVHQLARAVASVERVDDKDRRVAQSEPLPSARLAHTGEGRIRRSTKPVPVVQRKETGSAAPNSTGMPDSLKAGLESVSGLDMSAVRVHHNSAEPARLEALAYTQGTTIEVGPGQESHLPHEAWHVVQQMQGRVRPTTRHGGAAINDDAGLEREADVMGAKALHAPLADGDLEATAPPAAAPIQRRVPPIEELRKLVQTTSDYDLRNMTVTTNAPSDAGQHAEGLRQLLVRQIQDISISENSGSVMTLLNVMNPTGLTIDQILSVGTAEQLLSLARSVLTLHKGSELGAPEGYMAPPANTTELDNIRDLVGSANQLFNLMRGSTKTADVAEVFGAENVDKAIEKMTNAQTWLNLMFANSKILTDRSGYSGEVNLGGMSAAGHHILLPSAAIDNPGAASSKATLFHESMHAGNGDVLDDGGYIGSPGFKSQPHPVKLVNAAHYEVLAHRHLEGAGDERWSGAFTPPGAIVGGLGGGMAPEPTQTQKALRLVSERFRKAWTMSLWIRDTFLNVYKDPTLWSKDTGFGVTYQQCLPFWSKVERLTVHKRPTIDAASTDKSKKPVSQIDLALVESVTKRFNWGGQLVPKTEEKALEIADVYTDGSNFEYVFDFDGEVDALTRYILQRIKITADPGRDLRAVKFLSDHFDFKQIFVNRNPDDFAD